MSAGRPAEPAARSAWRDDCVAGVAVAGLLLPEAIAYAGIAGLPPRAGLVGLFAGLVCYAALGRSPAAIVSATSSSAAVLGAATLSFATASAEHRLALAAVLVLMTGLVLAIAAAARLGAVSEFISRPVLHGFSFGLALTISVRQFATMAGLPGCAPQVLRCALQIADAAPRWHTPSLLLGLVALAALLLLGRWRRLPGSLLVLAGCTVAAQVLGLAQRGVATVGTFDLGAALGVWPALRPDEWTTLAELSLPLALLLFAESWGSIRAVGPAGAAGANRELAALAAANLASGLLHGTPVGAGFSATLLNAEAGARSRRSGLVAAAAAALVVLLAMRFVVLAPDVALGAIVIVALRHGLDPRRLRRYFRWRRDRTVLVAAAVAVILLGIVAGLLIGIATSLMMTLRELARPRLTELGRIGGGHDFLSLDAHRDARAVPGVTILRPEAPLFFANAERLLAEAQRVCRARATRGFVLSLEETPDLDATALQALDEFCTRLDAMGCAVALARLKDPVVALLQRCGLAGIGSALRVAGSVDDAVAALVERRG